MADINGTTCCGIKEIHTLTDAKTILKMVWDKKTSNNVKAAFYLFSDKGFLSNGARLAAYIIFHNLGKVTATPARKNPNSGNRLQAWLWAVDYAKLEEWYKKQKWPLPEQCETCGYLTRDCDCCPDCERSGENCRCNYCGDCDEPNDDCRCNYCGQCDEELQDCICCGLCNREPNRCSCCKECNELAENCTCAPQELETP